IVSVSSLERALPFYEGVLRMSRTYASDDLVTLHGDGLEVLLRQRTPTPGGGGVAPSFRVADVDAATASAVAVGARVVDAPADQPWGERQAVLHDPDGHLVCLVAPVG
ncbi:MAG: VOC family protein, partial [Micrococcales bacterium]|nr:VOC family protein [Micrococcales bacterium]